MCSNKINYQSCKRAIWGRKKTYISLWQKIKLDKCWQNKRFCQVTHYGIDCVVGISDSMPHPFHKDLLEIERTIH